MRRLRSRSIAIFGSAAAAAVALLATAAPALASPAHASARALSSPAATHSTALNPDTADGYTFFGPFTIGGHTVESGYLEGTTDGSGLTVNDEVGDFEVVGLICNWKINFAFFDTNNKLYKITYGGVNGNCTPFGERIWNAPGGAYHAKSGRLCATLYSNGIYIARQCNSIHP